MNKYLFLLGFFLFSISFLSGCKMSDFYSAPVTNADSAPVADTDSAPAADTGPEVYKGIVYENTDIKSVSCNKFGMIQLKKLRDDGYSESIPEDKFPSRCDIGGFTRFVLFEKRDSSRDDYIYIESFISPDDGETWEKAYVELKSGLRLVSCENQNLNEQWKKDCKINMASYRKSKQGSIQEFPMEYQTTPGRAPDSIK